MYDSFVLDWEPEQKGGKPSRGTPPDKRLSENKPPKKPAFPNAAPPFPPNGGKGGKR